MYSIFLYNNSCLFESKTSTFWYKYICLVVAEAAGWRSVEMTWFPVSVKTWTGKLELLSASPKRDQQLATWSTTQQIKKTTLHALEMHYLASKIPQQHNQTTAQDWQKTLSRVVKKPFSIKLKKKLFYNKCGCEINCTFPRLKHIWCLRDLMEREICKDHRIFLTLLTDIVIELTVLNVMFFLCPLLSLVVFVLQLFLHEAEIALPPPFGRLTVFLQPTPRDSILNQCIEFLQWHTLLPWSKM